jgi:uncharacterized C2H2 Zn-finger protein
MTNKGDEVLTGKRSQFFATREFGYNDDYPILDRHQVIELQGEVNDQKLVNLRYLLPVGVGEELFQCAHCGAIFMSLGTREAHGELRHSYVCECGWKPASNVRMLSTSLNNHRARCPVYQDIRAKDRTKHVKEVLAIPNRND